MLGRCNAQRHPPIQTTIRRQDSQLVRLGLDPDPRYGRGLCQSCHNAWTGNPKPLLGNLTHQYPIPLHRNRIGRPYM
jgi:hypothetical protein